MIKGAEKEIIKKIKKLETKNSKVVKAVEEMNKVRVRVLRDYELQIKNELVLKERKIYILKNENLKLEIIWPYHNILIVEHGEQWKTVRLVTRNYSWPGVTKEVKRYVKKCGQYQRIKSKIEILIGKLNQI